MGQRSLPSQPLAAPLPCLSHAIRPCAPFPLPLPCSFFDQISQDTGKFVFGVKDTLACLVSSQVLPPPHGCYFPVWLWGVGGLAGGCFASRTRWPAW